DALPTSRMLSRAGCRLLLTERGSTTMLDQALESLSGVETLFIDAAYEEGHADGGRSGDRRGGRGGPDGAAVLRHLAVATGFPATGRWADPDRRAGDDPRREAFHRQDRRGRVAVVQVAPSYLEVLLSYLAQHPPRAAGLAV